MLAKTIRHPSQQIFERWTPRTQELPHQLARQSEAKRKQAPQSEANVCRRRRRKCNRVIFVWPWKMVSVSVRHLFHEPMDEKIKTWTLRFPAKENPNMEKAWFDWPIVLPYDVKAKYRLISRKFSGMKFFHPNVRLTNQKPRVFVSVR